MTREPHIDAPLNRVVVCHSEGLLAAAAGAVLRSTGTAFSTVAVDSIRLLLANLRPGVDVVVLFDSPEWDIGEMFDALHRRGLATAVLVLTTAHSSQRAAELLELGAAGSLSAGCSPIALCDGVIDARNGGAVFDHGVRDQVLQVLRERRWLRDDAQRRLADLTVRERHALRSLADGMSVDTIAVGMSVSPHTVRGYLRTLGAKLSTSGQLRIAASARELFAAAREPDSAAHLEMLTGGHNSGATDTESASGAHLMHIDTHSEMHVDAPDLPPYVPPLT